MSQLIQISVRQDAAWALDWLKRHHINISGLFADLITQYCIDQQAFEGTSKADPEMDALDAIVDENERFVAKNKLRNARLDAKIGYQP